jgi:hypothetical protein
VVEEGAPAPVSKPRPESRVSTGSPTETADRWLRRPLNRWLRKALPPVVEEGAATGG